MGKFTKLLLILISAGLIIIQFLPVERTNPQVMNKINAPDKVMKIMEKSCFDCHSNETKWPWYSYVAPISFLVIHDVEEGREYLNFSEWGNYPFDKQNNLKVQIWEEVEQDKMPLNLYTFTHPNAVVTFNEKQIIKTWVHENK